MASHRNIIYDVSGLLIDIETNMFSRYSLTIKTASQLGRTVFLRHFLWENSTKDDRESIPPIQIVEKRQAHLVVSKQPDEVEAKNKLILYLILKWSVCVDVWSSLLDVGVNLSPSLSLSLLCTICWQLCSKCSQIGRVKLRVVTTKGKNDIFLKYVLQDFKLCQLRF